MNREEVWEYLKGSNKVRFVHSPAFMINLENGDLVYNEIKHNKLIHLLTFRLDNEEDIVKMVDNSDYFYVFDKMDESMKVYDQKDEMNGLSLSFEHTCFRFYFFNEAQRIEWLEKDIKALQNQRDCKAYKPEIVDKIEFHSGDIIFQKEKQNNAGTETD